MKQETLIEIDKSIQTNFINADILDINNKHIKDRTVDLIIADPPYFKVIGEKWDYIWRTEDDYLDWTKKWIEKVSNKIRYGGSMYIFGYFRHLVNFMEIAKNYGFEFRQQIILDKGIKSVAGRKTSTYKMFPNVTESILFFIKDNKKIIKPLLLDKAKKLNLKPKEINDRLGVKSNGGGMWSIYCGNNICEQFPTKKTWEKLCSVLELDIKYESMAQTFNTQMGLTDVWTDIEFYFKDRIHPTQKPFKLIERLILASSNKGDLILDPFSGSAVTGLASALNHRNSILVEMNKDYFDSSFKNLESEGINVADIS